MSKTPAPKSTGGSETMTLDLLSVEAVDGIAAKIKAKLEESGIKTLEDLAAVDTAQVAEKTQIPEHRIMEYKKKAQKILELELDDSIITALAGLGFTIEQAIEQNPNELMKVTDRTKAEIMTFLESVIEITMFLDAYTCRSNSIGLLHRKKKELPKLPKEKKARGDTLDELNVGVIDGVGPKIEQKLEAAGVKNLDELSVMNPVDTQPKTGIPMHKLMEYQKKAELTLDLELESDIIDKLAEKNYTIQDALEAQPDVIERAASRDKYHALSFLNKLTRVTMFLDTETNRNNSIAILKRKKKEVGGPKEGGAAPPAAGTTLDTLPVSAIDGVGPNIESNLNDVNISTIGHLASANPGAIYRILKMPIHKVIELRKKAQMVLALELNPTIIDSLAAENYTIAQAIEEDPTVVQRMSGQDRDRVAEFQENVVQVTMFLDHDICRTNSIAILHKSTPSAPGAPAGEAPEYVDVHYLGKDQILAKIFSTELDYNILKLLRERARNRTEIVKILESKIPNAPMKDINESIVLFVQTELVQMEWFEGNFDVHLFLISDFGIFRTPAFKIIEEAEKHLPTPTVADQYLEKVAEFFDSYKPNYEDNLFVAQNLRDPDIFVTLTLLRERIYPLKKFPKGMGESKVDMKSIIDRMEKAGIVTIIRDETKEDWVMLLTDIRLPQFYPEYMLENIRRDAEEKKVTPQLAAKHLDLLEVHYDTFHEVYDKFFQWD